MTTKIAIIGSGISGLTAAYLLNRRCDVTVFEKEERIGGHTATIDFSLDGEEYAIDTGFIVFNDWTYPNFIKLLDKIGVESQATSMGFSVSCTESGLEYAGNNLNTLFAQRSNIFSPKFICMVRDILRFNREAKEDLADNNISKDMTLGEYLDKNAYSETFSRYYLVPMGAAIWSASLSAMRDFPVCFFVEFFHNHGLLNVKNRPTWRVISGGSKQYLGPLTESFREKIVTSANIVAVTREEGVVHIEFSDGHSESFDQVIFATHSDQALSLLKDASKSEKEILSTIPYSDNSVVLHTDISLLPKKKLTWSSWNYRLDGKTDALPVVTYDMNLLQGLDSPHTFCVSLNADELIDPNKVIRKFTYAHPQFTLPGMLAQDRWPEINGVNRTWFCGAYWANGFHEDGVVSALRVAEQFGEFL
ncbi:MAG: FAD-dependent oxidoreductase [Agarilytica sp.]